MTARSLPAPSLRGRPWLVGAAALGLYLAVSVVMLTLGGHRVLPLFEGVGPPPKYQWVNAPPQFAAGNVKPTTSTQNLPLSGGRSALGTVQSSDGQLIISLPDGAFTASGSDTAVRAVVTPLDPATLGPPPPGLAADGNAYRAAFTYEPSGAAATVLTSAGSLVMNAPHQAQVILFSRDGRSWQRLASQPAGVSSVGAAFTTPGWYLVGTSPAVVAGATASHGSAGTIIIAIGAGVLAVIAAVLAAREVRRRRAKPSRPNQARRPPTKGRRPTKGGTPPRRRR